MYLREPGIYQIVNRTNGKRYIGSAVNLNRRWVHHHSNLKHCRHFNAHLQNAWNRYGATAFAFEVLERVPEPERLVGREQHYLNLLNPEYNLCPTAGNCLGLEHTRETCLKLSVMSKDRWRNPVFRQQQSEAFRAAWANPERRQRQSEALKAAWARPGYRQQHKTAMAAVLADQDYRQKQGEATAARWADLEVRQRHSETMAAHWADPEFRQKMLEAHKGRTFSSEENRRRAAHIGNHYSAKLSEQTVWEIRVLLAESTLRQREIAARYGVSQATISNIKRAHTWPYVGVLVDGECADAAP